MANLPLLLLLLFLLMLLLELILKVEYLRHVDGDVSEIGHVQRPVLVLHGRGRRVLVDGVDRAQSDGVIDGILEEDVLVVLVAELIDRCGGGVGSVSAPHFTLNGRSGIPLLSGAIVSSSSDSYSLVRSADPG